MVLDPNVEHAPSCWYLTSTMLTSSRLYRWYNVTYTLFAVSILLTAVFRNFAVTDHALDDIFGHIDSAIAVLQAMDECTVAKNAICIIKRTTCRAKRAQQPALNVDTTSNPQEPGMERSTWNGVSPNQGGGFPGIFSEVETEGTMYGTVEEGLDWLDTDSDPLDDGQLASFWTAWAQGIDVLGT